MQLQKVCGFMGMGISLELLPKRGLRWPSDCKGEALERYWHNQSHV